MECIDCWKIKQKWETPAPPPLSSLSAGGGELHAASKFQPRRLSEQTHAVVSKRGSPPTRPRGQASRCGVESVFPHPQLRGSGGAGRVGWGYGRSHALLSEGSYFRLFGLLCLLSCFAVILPFLFIPIYPPSLNVQPIAEE